jgi:hypothetical protein
MGWCLSSFCFCRSCGDRQFREARFSPPAAREETCLTGSPGLVVDSTVSDSFALDLRQLEFLEAARRGEPAARRIGERSRGLCSIPRLAGCDPLAATNLGEPLDSSSPCFGFLPIISVSSGSRIEGGRGQGVLLADGDLELADAFDFYGVVVVAGRLYDCGAGTRVTGLVPCGTARVTPHGLPGSVPLPYLAVPLHVRRVGSIPLRPLSGHGWSRF